MIPIILAGGSGTRFWPLSRRANPKQLLSILGDDRSMMETTIERLKPLASTDSKIHIVCRPGLVDPTREVLSEPDSVEFIEEPAARNTAPAIALAAARMESLYGDEPLAFFPADHFVAGQDGFEKCSRLAEQRARDGAIITIGIPPTRPETGYGYIRTGTLISDSLDPLEAYPVDAFVEKPDHRRALKYLEAGRYFWNAGIFVVRPSTLWAEFERQQPQMWQAIDEIRTALSQDAPPSQIAESFAELESISIDYAVMEEADHVEVVPALFRWSDVGHWGALDEVMETDERNNVIDADVLLDDVNDCVVVSKGSSRLIAASGLDDLIIVDTKDALLVLPKERTQKVREIVAELRRRKRDDLL